MVGIYAIKTIVVRAMATHMIDSIPWVRGAVFPLPEAAVYCFPSEYPYPKEVYAPVWEKGSGHRIPCVAVGKGKRRVLLFHGNGETIINARGLAVRISKLCNATVYLMEFPGYWRGEDGHVAQRSAKAVYEAAAETAAIIAEGGEYHVMGYSLGTAVAVRVAKEARQHQSRVLTLSLIAPICSAMSAFASSPADDIPTGLKMLVSLIKPMMTPRDIFCAERDAPMVRVPSTVVYGTADKVVANSQGACMTELLHSTYQIIAGRDHSTILDDKFALHFIKRHVIDHDAIDGGDADYNVVVEVAALDRGAGDDDGDDGDGR